MATARNSAGPGGVLEMHYVIKKMVGNGGGSESLVYPPEGLRVSEGGCAARDPGGSIYTFWKMEAKGGVWRERAGSGVRIMLRGGGGK